MALFSDIDWGILLAVAGFLFLGKESGAALRQFGRYYGRFVRLKQELLGELTRAAELPAPPTGGALSLRGALLGYPEGSATPGIPIAVTSAPIAGAAIAAVASPAPVTPIGLGPDRWSVALPSAALEAPFVR
jgi:hypothetical protein